MTVPELNYYLMLKTQDPIKNLRQLVISDQLGCNRFHEQLAWFIKKSKHLNQSHIASHITPMTCSVNSAARHLESVLNSPAGVPMHKSS